MTKGTHPNSLKNLAPLFTKENAKEMQLRSAASRKASSDARQALKMSMGDWKKYKEDVLDHVDMNSLDVLKILMFKALEKEDFDTASDLAAKVAEYEQPKLQRRELQIEELGTDALSDEELDSKLKALRIV
jgi:hypothetical protein|tara:strand:- start:1207 stop:1599 length:393 start_codon:yes stop_codon:yes gene_type:complete